jgi:hypothetical protein
MRQAEESIYGGHSSSHSFTFGNGLRDMLSSIVCNRWGKLQRVPRVRKELAKPDEIVDVKESCKIPEFLKKSPLSEAGKTP